MRVFDEAGLVFLMDGINRRCGSKYYTVGSAIMLVLKMCICPNVIIKEKFEHHANLAFAYAWFCPWETIGEHRTLQ